MLINVLLLSHYIYFITFLWHLSESYVAIKNVKGIEMTEKATTLSSNSWVVCSTHMKQGQNWAEILKSSPSWAFAHWKLAIPFSFLFTSQLLIYTDACLLCYGSTHWCFWEAIAWLLCWGVSLWSTWGDVGLLPSRSLGRRTQTERKLGFVNSTTCR